MLSGPGNGWQAAPFGRIKDMEPIYVMSARILQVGVSLKKKVLTGAGWQVPFLGGILVWKVLWVSRYNNYSIVASYMPDSMTTLSIEQVTEITISSNQPKKHSGNHRNNTKKRKTKKHPQIPPKKKRDQYINSQNHTKPKNKKAPPQATNSKPPATTHTWMLRTQMESSKQPSGSELLPPLPAPWPPVVAGAEVPGWPRSSTHPKINSRVALKILRQTKSSWNSSGSTMAHNNFLSFKEVKKKKTPRQLKRKASCRRLRTPNVFQVQQRGVAELAKTA